MGPVFGAVFDNRQPEASFQISSKEEAWSLPSVRADNPFFECNVNYAQMNSESFILDDWKDETGKIYLR